MQRRDLGGGVGIGIVTYNGWSDAQQIYTER
jgi:hypothetical protein